MIKKILFLLFLIFSVCLIVYFIYLKNTNKNIIKLYGNVEIRQVDLSFQVSGVINKVYVEEGDYVKKGELIAEIDSRDYLANYNKAKNAEQNLKVKLKEDESIFNRNYPLCFDDTISKQYCETILNNKDSTRAQYKESIANTKFHKNQLDYTKLYAPQDGIISTRAREMGSRISPGEIVYVMNISKPVWIRTYISEKDFGNIKYGISARVLTDTIDPINNKKREYKGYVGFISPVAEFTPKTVQTEDLRADLVYRIRVYIEDIDEYIKQGMPVTVEFDLSKNE